MVNVVQGRQSKGGWKTVASMRMATTIQLIRIDGGMEVSVPIRMMDGRKKEAKKKMYDR